MYTAQFVGEETLCAKERLDLVLAQTLAAYRRFDGDTGSSEVQGMGIGLAQACKGQQLQNGFAAQWQC